jgi:integrase
MRRETADGRRRWSDRTVNRVMAHLKTFAKWVHKLKPFPLGNPMEKIKLQPLGTGLEVERALTTSERRKILDAADLLLEIGGRSRDRGRYRGTERPKRKGYRALRNRAIIYTLIETGMRRSAVAGLDLRSIDFKKKTVIAEEKGGIEHGYQISNEGLQAIRDYIERERPQDGEKWRSTALFLSPVTNPHGNGRLTPQVINDVWNEVRLRPYFRVILDLLVRSRRPPFGKPAVDTKYKLYDQRKLSPTDVYQSFHHAYAFGQGGANESSPAALIIYPSVVAPLKSVRLCVRGANNLVGAEICALGISIPNCLSAVRGAGGGQYVA